MAVIQKFRSRRRFRSGPFHWDAQQKLECLNSESRGVEDGLWFQPYPGLSAGVYTPFCIGIDVTENYDPNRRPGYALVHALYKTLRQPGKAKIGITSSLESALLEKDLGGLRLIGKIDTKEEPNKIGRYKTNGGKYQQASRRVFVWRAAFDTKAGVNSLNNMMNRVNVSRSPRMFNAPAQTLRVFRMEVAHVWTGYDLWYVNVYFEEEPDGWNNVIKRYSEVKIPVRMPVFTLSSDGKSYTPVTDSKQTDVITWVKGYLDNTTGTYVLKQPDDQDTRVFKTTSFANFNNLLDEF